MQIDYKVDFCGKQKSLEIPFVVGVMADFTGNPGDPLPPVSERKFLHIDVDTLDSRLKVTRPRVAFIVPNTLTGEGNLSVDVTFESLDDFSPGAVAWKVEALRVLLVARIN